MSRALAAVASPCQRALYESVVPLATQTNPLTHRDAA